MALPPVIMSEDDTILAGMVETWIDDQLQLRMRTALVGHELPVIMIPVPEVLGEKIDSERVRKFIEARYVLVGWRKLIYRTDYRGYVTRIDLVPNTGAALRQLRDEKSVIRGKIAA